MAAERASAAKSEVVSPIRDDFDFGWIAQAIADWMAVAESGGALVCLVDAEARIIRAKAGFERFGVVADAAKLGGLKLHDVLHPGCSRADCAFAVLAADIAAAQATGKATHRTVHDSVLGRPQSVAVAPVRVMPSAWQPGAANGAAIIRLLDPASRNGTEDWLRSSLDDLNIELKRRTAALEQASERQQQAATALKRSESELRLVSAALLTMQEIERKRIATELHDSIGQSLSAVNFGVGVALDTARSGNSPATCDMLDKLAAQMRETIAEVRRIAMDLRPATLDDLGIVGTLSWFFREFRGIHPGLALVTEVALFEEDVPAALRTTIFRIVQEALNNVVKHARATAVRISLRRSDGEIQLGVADDGCGVRSTGTVSAGVSGSGMGLMGMRDRAESSGGRFRLDSEPGNGTRIQAAWPLDRKFGAASAATTNQHAIGGVANGSAKA